ncbi:MAG: MBL fold metallo-hydrolase [Ignavibacteriales bacterium]|nr:MBL fold metallo-hydrolase [Ignavibacteriales bacterium]
MKIGKYKLSLFVSGYFSLDGGAMFGIIPKPLWSKTNPTDEQNRVRLATRHLILQSDNRNIIIDTGMGNKWDDKSKSIYNIDSTHELEHELEDELELEPELNNISAASITDVLLTHLHFDHTGGSTKIENGKLIPTFPNAKYYVQKKNYDWAVNPSDRDKGSYIKENFEPLMKEGVLHFINGEEQFDDEISFILVNGHTFYQQLIKISDGDNTFLFVCDLLPFASHIPLPYIMGYDLQPLVTLNEKKIILKQAVDENWKLFFYHDPEIAYATLMQTDKGIRVQEKFSAL